MTYGSYADISEDDPPELRTHDSIRSDADEFEQMVLECDGDRKQPDASNTRGVNGLSPLHRLEYFDIATMTLLDMMHLTSGVYGRHLMHLITGDRIKSVIASEDQIRVSNIKRKKNEAVKVARAVKVANRQEFVHMKKVAKSKKASVLRAQPAPVARVRNALVLPRFDANRLVSKQSHAINTHIKFV